MKDTSRDPWGNRRAYGVGGQARFLNPPMTEPSLRRDVSLPKDHPAVLEARSVFPSRVFDAGDRDHVLIPGINNAKTGNHIVVGPWAGCRQFNLSLEERATCPRSCAVWLECFGNKMPMAVRFRYTESLMLSLDGELSELSRKHPGGFAVRLHVLGDFPDVAYLRQWAEWSDSHPALHVWGYTAHGRETPIGRFLRQMNARRPERWMIRFSVAEWMPHAPMQVTTTWHKPDSLSFDPETSSMICPQEIGKTPHCATCGICWKPELAHIRVVFMGHGARHDTAAQKGPLPATR